MIEFGHATHAGLHREHNEDTYWADAQLGLFLVVDGMGGHGRGEVAAAIVRDTVVDAALAEREFDTAIRGAGETIATWVSEATGSSPMGATLALLKVWPDGFEVVRIGDARVCLFQHGRLQAMCGNDSAVAIHHDEPPSIGVLASGDAERNRITQALGITPSEDLSTRPSFGIPERGMQFLLCTDGLTEELDDTHIAAVLARTDLAAQECVDHLLLAALDAGGRDNISLILVRVL
ncbi:MAG: PP2C family protein-serine/threonine phosphatase [Rhodanobacteraceae bacterium]